MRRLIREELLPHFAGWVNINSFVEAPPQLSRLDLRSRPCVRSYSVPSFRRPLLALLISTAAAQEWTRFRGPNGTGESEATTIPASWTDKDLNWKIELPGIGHSSPVLWGDKIFLLERRPG